MIDMLISARDACAAARPVTAALTQGQTQQIFTRYYVILDEGSAIHPEAKREGAENFCIIRSYLDTCISRATTHSNCCATPSWVIPSICLMLSRHVVLINKIRLFTYLT